MAALQSQKVQDIELRDGIDLRTPNPVRAPTKDRELRLQVICDVDDTIKSSGGVTIAGVAIGGVDTQYKRGTMYPGVFRFMCALSKCGVKPPPPSSTLSEPAESPLKVAVLTARAEEFKWALQLKPTDPVCRGFSDAGKVQGFEEWGIGQVMYGSVREWVIQDLKGWRKFENFKLLRQTYAERGVLEPEGYVFVGDTGELDKECGMRMLTDKETSKRVRAIFLHVVSYSNSPDPVVPRDSYINGKPVVYFRTYVGAALKACQLGFMDTTECRAVILQACDDLRDQHHRSTVVGATSAPSGSSGGSGSHRAAASSSNGGGGGGGSKNSTGSSGGGGGGEVFDAAFPSKWTDLQRDIEAAMKAFPAELGDMDPALLQPQRPPPRPQPSPKRSPDEASGSSN